MLRKLGAVPLTSGSAWHERLADMQIDIAIMSSTLNIRDLRKAVNTIDNAFTGNHPNVKIAVTHSSTKTVISAWATDSDE